MDQKDSRVIQCGIIREIQINIQCLITQEMLLSMCNGIARSALMRNRPNVVIITTHDSGKHFGCYGAGGVSTPNIDAVASRGIRFDRMFSPSSMCTPSRGALLTGQWPEAELSGEHRPGSCSSTD